MPDYFAAFLDLRGRRCLVVGGGQIAERKARALLECGAHVVVVSPAVTPALAALAAAGRLVDRRAHVSAADLRGCALVVAASGDRGGRRRGGGAGAPGAGARERGGPTRALRLHPALGAAPR